MVFATVLVVLASMGGCRSSAVPPTFTLSPASVEPRSAKNPDAPVLLFQLTGDNANRDPIVLTDVRYECSIAGRRVFTATRRAGATLRAFGQNTVTLPVPVPPQTAVGQQSYSIRATVGYVPPGTFSQTLYDAGLLEPTASADATGTADLGAN